MPTTSTAFEVDRRRRNRAPAERLTMASSLAELVLHESTLASRIRFPSPYYQRDPVEYFRKVLGVEPWSKQIEVIEAIRDYKRVAVSSGHKVSKSHTAAGAALWFYSSWEDSRVIMSSTTARQVDQILWRELRMLRARSGRCVDCKEADPEGFRIRRPCPHSTIIDGEQGDLARTGLKSDDFREVVGFTAREAEAVAGISGRNLLYILDEASGIPDEIFEAIEGNRAGGARVVLLGNPTRNEGEFFEAFNSKADLYKTIRISSEETPNVVSGEEKIPGLATREWVEEKKVEWGEDSPLYKVRVKGQHAMNEEGRIFSLHKISLAEQRWYDTPDAGRLCIGVDPAGASGTGDEFCFAPRRGFKLLALRAARGLNEDQALVQLLLIIAEFGLQGEIPMVVIDREGEIGNKLAIKLREYLSTHLVAFELATVRASDRSTRLPHIYDRMRDALAANLEQWMRDGGAIVEDTKLSKELHAMQWKQALNGRVKLNPPKDQLKKILGRSPDRFDALSLSVWETLSMRDDAVPPEVQQIAQQDHSAYASTGMDPYAGAAAWRKQ